MMSSMRLLLPFAILALSVSAEDYAIHLTKSEKVGDKTQFVQTAEVEENMVVSMGGNPVKQDKQSFTAKFAGVSKVLKVDKLNRGIEYEFTVDALEKRPGGASTNIELLRKGAKIVASRKGGKMIFLINGRPASKAVASVLSVFVSLPASDVTDDDVFGTKARRKVGESWAINAEAAKKQALGDLLKLEELTGRTKLEKAFAVDGVKYLLVTSKMKADKFSFPLPPFMKTSQATLSGEFSMEVPAEPGTATKSLESTMRMSMRMIAEGKPKPNAPVLRMEVGSKRVVRGSAKSLR